MSANINGRTYTAGKFLFEMDGTRVGFIQSCEGGHATAELATHNMGPNNYQKKNVTTIKYAPVKIRTGAGMSKGFWEWMRAALDLGVLYKNGAVTVADFNYKAQRRMDCMNMLMSKVTFPTWDGGSKETAYIDFEFSCEMIRWMKESGADVRGQVGPKQKTWHCSNFRYEMAGLPCKRVAKIEGLTWECKTAMDMIGDARENTIHPVATTITDFTLHISMADLDPWAAKADQWFRLGQCTEGDEMSSTITMLAPDMSTVVGTVELFNVGFKEFQAQPKLEAQTENVARFQVKCYAERSVFHPGNTDA